MIREEVIFLLLLLPLLILLFLPVFKDFRVIEYVYNFVSSIHKNYYEVVLSATSIYASFLIFHIQNQKEKEQNRENIEKEKLAQKKRYLEKKEERLASARPYFIVEKDKFSNQAKIKIFIEKDVPLENILVYEWSLDDPEDNIAFKNIDTKKSGDYIYDFSLTKLEMILVRCVTYFDEEIYFQYNVGDIRVHYRIVKSEEDREYSRSLGRKYLSDNLIELGEQYELDEQTEIYKENIYDSYEGKLAKRRFFSYRSKILIGDYHYKIYADNKNLIIIDIIEKEKIGEIFSKSINYLRTYPKDFSSEISVELLETIKKYLGDSWYTTCKKYHDPQYFKGNLKDAIFAEKWKSIFDAPVGSHEISNYIGDLVYYCQNNMDVDKFNEYLFRNLEVYLENCVEISESRRGFQNEEDTVYREIRSEIKRILSKTLI
ncbi:hypothetical protein FRX51_00130 [Streptococcus sp. sy010]|nr:hypothetical protein FRX51_00130 [Streptococcus sp. sy010]